MKTEEGGTVDNKKNNFKRISENRVSKILILFEQLTNLTNTSFYEYDNEDIEKIFNTIEKEMKKTKKILLESNSGVKNKKRFEL